MFKPAVRKKVKLKLGITGPSGSGKTYSALLIAKGLGGKIAVVDTENDSASLYSGNPKLPQFDSLSITPPFTVEKYLEAIQGAVNSSYDILIIDSLTHEWNGSGGLLEQKEALDKRGGNQYANWATITKQHEKFISGILHSPIHIIGTMRSKQEYAQEKDANGKTRIQKLGMAPIQRDGLEYELSVVFDMDESHGCQVSKDRTGIFDRTVFTPSEQTGNKLAAWLEGAAPALEKEDPHKDLGFVKPRNERPIDESDADEIRLISKTKNLPGELIMNKLKEHYGVGKLSILTRTQFEEFKAFLEGL